ncbi:MAG: hypothetical protein ACREE4_07555 [Stellaceae bacterium]
MDGAGNSLFPVSFRTSDSSADFSNVSFPPGHTLSDPVALDDFFSSGASDSLVSLNDSITSVAAVPEPASFAILGTALALLLGLPVVRRRLR